MTKGITLCDGTFKNLLRCLPSFVILCLIFFVTKVIMSTRFTLISCVDFFSVLICLINDK